MSNKTNPPKNKLLLHFEKYIINKTALLLLSFFIFTTTTFAQGTTCATAETLVINGACDNATLTDATQTNPTATGCTIGTFRREGWYIFTVPAGPDFNITIPQMPQIEIYSYN